jgi:outer membrane protein
MKIVRKLSLCVAATLYLAQAFGAEGILDVYRDALSNDPRLQQAASTRQAQQELQPQARALSLPVISAQGSLARNFPNWDSDFTDRSSGVFLNQPIYNRGNQVRQRQADITVEQADVDFDGAEQNLILRVASSYFDVLAGQDDVVFARANKEAIARQLEQVTRRFEVGLVTITDVQEAQARYDQSVATEIEVINSLADRREALREITGQYYEELQTLRDDLPLRLPDPSDPEAWVARALENNPELQSAVLAAEVARETIELERSGHYPTLDLNASYTDFDNGTIERRGSAVGLQLDIPIYQGGAVTSRTREAAYRYEAAKQRREEIQRAIIRQVQNAYRGVDASISLVRALDQAVTSGRSSLEATEAGFEVGTRTIVDVLDAQRDLLLAQRDYSQSRYRYVLNLLSLEQAAGDLEETDLDRIQAQLRPR